jgi:xanthine dehydrogenase accessory factor
MVTTGDIIGKLNNSPLEAPISGNLRGLLRNDAKVLANTRLAEINPDNDKSACYAIDKRMRAIAGGVLEAIMISLNVDDTYFD